MKFPEMIVLENKTLEQLRQLTVTQVMWNNFLESFGLTLSDGKNCEAGKLRTLTNSHTFDPAKKITAIETIIKKSEYEIAQINFYHNEERLVAVGRSD